MTDAPLNKCKRCRSTFPPPEGARKWLCDACHVDMAANSRRVASPCACGRVAACKKCRQREYKYIYDRRNREKNSEYHMDWRHANAEHYRDMKKAARQRRRERDQAAERP